MPSKSNLRSLVLTASAALAAGCGASAPASGSSPTLYHYGAVCQPSQLRLTAGPRVSEATQQHTLLLVFSNISATECDLRGYPGIALTNRTGALLAFTYRQRGDQMLTSRGPSRVNLRPGGVAYSAINKTTCVAFAARVAVRAEVTPPGDRAPLVLRLPAYPVLGYCGARDPGHIVDVAPVEPASTDVLAG
jgi:hypothetical protein